MGFRQLGKALPYLLNLPRRKRDTKGQEEEQRRFDETMIRRDVQADLKRIKKLIGQDNQREALYQTIILANKNGIPFGMSSQLWNAIFEENDTPTITDDVAIIRHKWADIVDWQASFKGDAILKDLRKSQIASYPVHLEISANVKDKSQLKNFIEDRWDEIEAALRLIQPRPVRTRVKEEKTKEIHDYVIELGSDGRPYASIVTLVRDKFGPVGMNEDRVAKILKRKTGKKPGQ